MQNGSMIGLYELRLLKGALFDNWNNSGHDYLNKAQRYSIKVALLLRVLKQALRNEVYCARLTPCTKY